MFTFVKINFKLQLLIVNSTNMFSHASTTHNDLKKLDWTNSKIVSARLHNAEYEILNTTNISWSDFRYKIFCGIPTPDLLDNFASITSDTNRGANWRPFDFLQWMTDDDGLNVTFYIRNSDTNQVMKDILKAIDGGRNALCQAQSCFFKVRLPNGVEHTIKTGLYTGIPRTITREQMLEFLDFD
jgi:hypothetical protein